MKSSIYIIGANGYLGSKLTTYYENLGTRVTKAPRFNFNQIWLDEVTNEIKNNDFDTILIPGADQNPLDDQEAAQALIFSNCNIPTQIAAEIKNQKKRTKLIVFSTSWQYSDTEYYRPFNLYAATKMAAENLLEHYALSGVQICSLMLFDVYGPNDKRNKLYNILEYHAKNNLDILITPGDQEIELVHVDDVCNGVDISVRQLDHWDPNKGLLKYGLGHGRPITVKELAENIFAKYKSTAKIIAGGRKYRPREIMKTRKKYNRPKGWALIHKEHQVDNI
jgi:nucleoside-diphosphate-sugar epimerase